MDGDNQSEVSRQLHEHFRNGGGANWSLRHGGLHRRDFLQIIGGAASAVLAPGFLAGCGGERDTSPAVAGLLYDHIYKEHLTSDDQPERPARCDAIMNGLADLRLRLKPLLPRQASVDELLLCHRAAYIDLVRKETQSTEFLSTGDVHLCRDSYKVARYAAGGAMVAVDEVITGEVRRVFCVVRPPGHHATPSRGMGFCIFNNAALAARYAQYKHKIGKVAIIDWDVHHGNGTQEIFYSDGTVFYFSTHQQPWFPHTGRAEETGSGDGRGCILNCPLPAGSGHKEIVEECFRGKLLPALDKFKPELIIISAGFDSRKGDQLGGFMLEDLDFAELTMMMMEVARRYANGRIVSVLEGGYNLQGLARAAKAHVGAFML